MKQKTDERISRARRDFQLLIEYDPQPPFNAGSQAKASPSMIERAKKILAAVYSQSAR